MNDKTKQSSRPQTQDRRDFMKTTTLAGAGIAAAAAVPGAALAAGSEEPAKKPQQGYHVTRHIIDYYKSLT